jgi:hypothetical protein
MADMNLDELRDAHAKRLGWDTYTASNGIVVWFKGGFGVADDPYQQNSKEHPIPASLDAIAGLMPPGWDMQIVVCKTYAMVQAVAGGVPWCYGVRSRIEVVDGDQKAAAMHALGEAAWLAWEAEAKGAGQ